MQSQIPYEQLLSETKYARDEFLAIPLIASALNGQVERALYLRYLEQAYHHVKHTCPLLGAAVARCGRDDEGYREALLDYIDEERGHEKWILEDIAALGGDAAMVRQGDGNIAIRIMVGYAYYAIEHASPYALLGMVHVLEGMSVQLATRAARAIAGNLGVNSELGFSYLRSHGDLDKDHVKMFENLLNGIHQPDHHACIIDMAKIMYRLFGDVFHSLDGDYYGAGEAV